MRDTAFSTAGARLVRRRVRYYYLLIALITVMFGAEMVMHFTQAFSPPSRWIVAGTAVTATGLAMGSGLTVRDLGLARDTVRRGLIWSAVIVGVVVLVIGAGLAIPWTREFFHNDSYRDLRKALVSAFVLIPLLTAIPEELLFRGVLLGALLRRHSARVAVGVQALLFGLWHVVSSTRLAADNQGIGDTVGSGAAGVALGILGAVAFTGIAGVIFGRLRVRTGSLIPCVALHCVVNGTGAVAAALAWQIG
ncbi:MAG: CPBP family intramembrane metalloprotease [Gordonia sp. (in: high G+C Gram-positive bacteria)]|uniref:CPBP family intramembrane glutamic endopeptidase n=1 Tax=Gordonia sp. (in: high G+C Gram-positive bacteria) TaxID=84139 RepID=UPI0039E62679